MDAFLFLFNPSLILYARVNNYSLLLYSRNTLKLQNNNSRIIRIYLVLGGICVMADSGSSSKKDEAS